MNDIETMWPTSAGVGTTALHWELNLPVSEAKEDPRWPRIKSLFEADKVLQMKAKESKKDEEELNFLIPKKKGDRYLGFINLEMQNSIQPAISTSQNKTQMSATESFCPPPV